MSVHYRVNLPRYMNEKSGLFKLLTELNGGKKLTDDQMKVFRPAEWVGKACSVMVVHTDDGKYANVKSVSSLPSKIKLETEQFNPSKTLDLDYFVKDDFDSLHDRQKTKVQVSPEYQALFAEGNASLIDEDELPF